MISRAVYLLFNMYFLLIILRIFLSWIPSIDWTIQPFSGVKKVTDAYLDIFRRVIPPIGMLDISPIVAIILLQIVQSLICGTLQGLGL